MTNPRSYTRYKNPELDAILDKMEAMTPSPKDEAYMKLARDATAIFLRDLPEITLGEELHVVTFNSTLLDRLSERRESLCRALSALGGFQSHRSPAEAAKLTDQPSPFP